MEITEKEYLKACQIKTAFELRLKTVGTKNYIAKMMARVNKEALRMKNIRYTSELLIKEFDLRNNCRAEHIRVKRQALMWWLKKNTDMSVSEIGRIFCKNHATVINATKVIDNYIEYNDVRMMLHCNAVWELLKEYKK